MADPVPPIYAVVADRKRKPAPVPNRRTADRKRAARRINDTRPTGRNRTTGGATS